MTKKDYILIAGAINVVKKGIDNLPHLTESARISRHQGISDIVIQLSGELKKQNPLFNHNKFVEACNK